MENSQNKKLERQATKIERDIVDKTLRGDLEIYEKDIAFTQEQLVTLKKRLDKKVIQSCYKL